MEVNPTIASPLPDAGSGWMLLTVLNIVRGNSIPQGNGRHAEQPGTATYERRMRDMPRSTPGDL